MISSQLPYLRSTFTIIFFCCALFLVKAQYYTPIALRGFNHDVVAEGSGNSSLITTSLEMDAINPSNYVLFTKQFAKANKIPLGYGLPDNGMISNRGLTFKLQPYTAKNTLYLFRNQFGRLHLIQPKEFTELTILGLGTEEGAELQITLKYTDSTAQIIKGMGLPDWFDGPQPFVNGFGRVKRANGSVNMPLYYQGELINPMMYTITLKPTAGKRLAYMLFQNVSVGTENWKNRAFVFAASGVAPVPKEEKKEPVTSPPITTETEKKSVDQSPIVIKNSEADKKTVASGIIVKCTITDAKTNKSLESTLNFSGELAPLISNNGVGYFLVGFPKAGDYVARIEAPGYMGITQTINITSDKEINFTLTPIEIGASFKLNNILFEQSSPRLKEESFPELDNVVSFLKANPNVSIKLSGHTDNRGDKKLNLKLSNDRVAEVKKYLVMKGINTNRITGKGYGGSKPIAPGNNEEAWKVNRRVEFTITGI